MSATTSGQPLPQGIGRITDAPPRLEEPATVLMPK